MSMQISAEVLALWNKSQKVEAIKLMREQTGLGLKDTKDLLEAYSEARANGGIEHSIENSTEHHIEVDLQPQQNQAEAMQQLRDQLSKMGMKDASALLGTMGASGKSGTTTLKTTTTTINGKTVTSITASGDPEVAARMLMSNTGMAHEVARAKVDEAMAGGNKLEAIKLLRDMTGLGLAEAKDQIDAAMNGEPLDWQNLPNRPQQTASQAAYSSAISPGEVPRSQGWFWWLLVLLALAAGAWFYFKSP